MTSTKTAAKVIKELPFIKEKKLWESMCLKVYIRIFLVWFSFMFDMYFRVTHVS